MYVGLRENLSARGRLLSTATFIVIFGAVAMLNVFFTNNARVSLHETAPIGLKTMSTAEAPTGRSGAKPVSAQPAHAQHVIENRADPVRAPPEQAEADADASLAVELDRAAADAEKIPSADPERDTGAEPVAGEAPVMVKQAASAGHGASGALPARGREASPASKTAVVALEPAAEGVTPGADRAAMMKALPEQGAAPAVEQRDADVGQAAEASELSANGPYATYERQKAVQPSELAGRTGRQWGVTHGTSAFASGDKNNWGNAFSAAGAQTQRYASDRTVSPRAYPGRNRNGQNSNSRNRNRNPRFRSGGKHVLGRRLGPKKRRQKYTAPDGAQYPKYCTCQRETRGEGVCYFFTSYNGDLCAKRLCRPKFFCVERSAAGRSYTCVLHETTHKVVPTSVHTCKVEKDKGIIYVPYI